MAEIIRSNAVDLDLLELWLHIAEEDPNAADRQVDRINQKCGLYAMHPELGQPRPDLAAHVRCFRVDKYVVVYRPTDDGILILLVIHSSRDILPLVRQRFEQNR